MITWKGITLLIASMLLLGMVFSLNTKVSVSAAEEEAGYIGVQKCKMCHKAEFESWSKTKHATAFSALKEEDVAKEDCVQCHTTGYGKTGGYCKENNGEAFQNVQCEDCHGPGSLHMKATKEQKKETIIVSPKEETCVGCHNEKSPNFVKFVFKDRLELVKHKEIK